MSGTIFLDFDGVLNSKASRSQTPCYFHSDAYAYLPLSKHRIDFDEDCIKVFKKIQEATGFYDIVISSSWRFGSRLEWFKELFDLYEIPYTSINLLPIGEYADESPKAYGLRGTLVEEYVKQNNISNFICIDDTKSHYYEFLDKKRVLFTDDRLGLTNVDLLQVLTTPLNSV